MKCWAGGIEGRGHLGREKGGHRNSAKGHLPTQGGGRKRRWEEEGPERPRPMACCVGQGHRAPGFFVAMVTWGHSPPPDPCPPALHLQSALAAPGPESWARRIAPERVTQAPPGPGGGGCRIPKDRRRDISEASATYVSGWSDSTPAPSPL